MQPPAGNSSVVFRALGLTKVYGEGEIEVYALRGIDLELRTVTYHDHLAAAGMGTTGRWLSGWEAGFILWEGVDVLQIAASPLFRQEGGWAIFTVDDGSAKLKPVTVGHRSGLSADPKCLAHDLPPPVGRDYRRVSTLAGVAQADKL